MKIRPNPMELEIGAAILNEACVKSPDGGPWTADQVLKLYERHLPSMAMRQQMDPGFTSLAEKLKEIIEKGVV